MSAVGQLGQIVLVGLDRVDLVHLGEQSIVRIGDAGGGRDEGRRRALAVGPRDVQRVEWGDDVVDPHGVGLIERLGDLAPRIVDLGRMRVHELVLPIAMLGLRTHPLRAHGFGRPDHDHRLGGVQLTVDGGAERSGGQEPVSHHTL